MQGIYIHKRDAERNRIYMYMSAVCEVSASFKEGGGGSL